MKDTTRRTQVKRADGRDAAEIVQGLHAGLAVFARRRDQILRVAYARAVRGELVELTRWAAAQRVPCEEMTEAELDRLAQSTHHEGLCVLAQPRRWLSTRELGDVLAQGGRALALDRVRNPYNVGAIIRTAAFFGLDALLLGTPAPHPGLAPTAVRVAEGGAEHVRLARTTDLFETLARLRAGGVRVIGADARSRAVPEALSRRGRLLLVLGNEREGLAPRVRSQCDAVVGITGTGAIESLNVSVAAGIFLAAMATAQNSTRDEAKAAT